MIRPERAEQGSCPARHVRCGFDYVGAYDKAERARFEIERDEAGSAAHVPIRMGASRESRPLPPYQRDAA